MISNRVINADQAMPFGGTVLVSMKNAEVGPDNGFRLAPGSHVAISLADQGIGIPGNCNDRIFDPYFATKREAVGWAWRPYIRLLNVTMETYRSDF